MSDSKYSCEKCGKQFAQKSHYQSHLKRKTPCENQVKKEVKKAINHVNHLLNGEINTFVDLYEFLQYFPSPSLLEWLNERWDGKDKQESLLRLFAGLGLIDKLNQYRMCKGNFNMKTISVMESFNDIFFSSASPISLKDKGDSSDLTCIHSQDDKHLLVTTSKNISKMNVGKLDIDKILTNFQQYDDYTMTLCLCVRDSDEYAVMKNGIEKTNKELLALLNKDDTIVIDWNDLNQAYCAFKRTFQSLPIDQLGSQARPLCLKMHQQLGVAKTLVMKTENKDKILWGHIQRSGKSYIIGGCIIQDSKQKEKCNYLIITTAPNETIEQQMSVFNCLQLKDFNVILLNDKDDKRHLSDKNIVVCSKQFLQSKLDKTEKTKSISWLKKMEFDMRFLDESHNGGTTELAQQTLAFYGKDAFTVQITATYSKPINDYNIPKENWILWDLEDIKLCKTISDQKSVERLIEKHSTASVRIEDIIRQFSVKNIMDEYSKYPDMWILTDKLSDETITQIIQSTTENNYGWSTDACFLLKQSKSGNEIVLKDEFQNEAETLKLWYRIFGKKNSFGIPDKEFPDDIVFMKRIEKICKNASINSRVVGETPEPSVIMCFLPQNNIDLLAKATVTLLKKHNVVPDYEIVSINSKTTNQPKQTIENARTVAKNSNKKGVLVLSGRQCSLGVSLKNCDVVLLLNQNTSFDMIEQMKYRSMTEEVGKKCGFVVDLNIQRVIESLIEYASIIRPSEHPKNAISYLLQERLINLNGDHWMPCFGNLSTTVTKMSETIYSIYSSNAQKALDHFLERLQFKQILLTKEENTLFNSIFHKLSEKQTKTLLEKLEKLEKSETIKDGIEKIEVDDEKDDEKEDDDEDDEKDDENKNYMDILKHVIPLICLLTIHSEESSFIEMFNLIEQQPIVHRILLDQTKTWWGKHIDEKLISNFISIYLKYMKNDSETNQIIRTVKELFVKNIKNSKELSSLIDKYLVPQELEKITNAEVSTPRVLRQEMLDKIPSSFWTSVKTVLEPCSGKGGFLIDIVDRFMEGLTDAIPDEKKRYQTIIEECLFFADINSTNIFICKLLLDPYNEYRLNVNEGNTLENDYKIGFDAVIGNPPYNSSGNVGTGNTIWQEFTKKALDEWIKPNGYLCFVHPPGWRKPNTDKGKFIGLYECMSVSNQMLYLSIHGVKDGMRTFSCGTRYDWYVIEKKKKYQDTVIRDELGNVISLNMKTMDWLPNYNIDGIRKILALDDEKCPILYNRSNYGSDKKHVSKTKQQEYKYPIVHTIPQTGIRYLYSNTNENGHFHIPKVIFGQTNSKQPIIDIEGLYGMSEHSMAIQVSDNNEALSICKALQSNKFQSILQSCSWSNFMIDWRLFTYFKKDFWKDFV